MSHKREAPEPIKQRDAGQPGHTHSGSVVLRKRIMGALLVVLMAMIFTMYVYYRSTYSRNKGDWRSFWIGEMIVGVWLVVGMVMVFTKRPK